MKAIAYILFALIAAAVAGSVVFGSEPLKIGTVIYVDAHLADTNAVYTLQRSSDLTDSTAWETTAMHEWRGTGGTVRLFESPASPESRFYRLLCKPIVTNETVAVWSNSVPDTPLPGQSALPPPIPGGAQ